MSQVRKDILNGWKEIGGYLGRDIRTVERWEKLRGLPVRRVPGAGRATVYALISELDQWLEASTQDTQESYAAEPIARIADPDQPLSQINHPPPPVMARAVGSAASEPLLAPAPLPGRPKLVIIRPSPASGQHTSLTGRLFNDIPSRKSIAAVVIALAACLLCVLVSPALRSHANPAAATTRFIPDSGDRISHAHYGSQVPGVDQLYLQGIYSYEQRTPESLQRSENDFSSAIEHDPQYAPAYAALANTYNLLREYSVMPDQVAYPKARTAALHAVALDPKLPDAHASLGFIDFFWLWDAVSAEREFKTAIALDPSSVLAHHWYGSMLTHEGRYKEALDQLDLAQRLDPASPAILSTRAYALGLSGHRGEAVDMLQNLISETPGVSSPHAILATLSKVEPQDSARFLFEMQRTAEMRHSDEMLQVAAAAEPALHTGGDKAMWTSILATEQRLHPDAASRSFLMVEAEAALGRDDDAFADLKLLLQRHDPSLIGIIVDPTLAPLRRDQRFGQLVASIGLPSTSH